MSERDDALEDAARYVERFSIEEMSGICAKRKRDREDAVLRSTTIRETRVVIAEELRRLKEQRDGDALAVLKRLARLPADVRHDIYLREAWPLAWRGLLDINVTIRTNSNCLPPEAEYRIVLTDRGRAALATPAGGREHG